MKTLDLDKAPIVSLFFKYYWPTVIGLLSVTLHQIIDGLILGQYVGEEGVSAVGLFGGPVITFFIAFFLPFGIGGGIMISKNLGGKNYEKAQRVFEFIVTYAFVFGAIVLLIGLPFTGPIAHFLTGFEDEALYNATCDYFLWGFIWLPMFFLRFILGGVVSHDGAPNVSRNATVIAVVVNILFDVLLVVVFPMGAAGASIATGLAVLTAIIYLAVYLLKEKGNLSLKKFRFRLKLGEWRQLISHGIPTLISELSFATGLLVINKVLVSYGGAAVAVFGTVNYLSFILIRFFTGAMIAVLPIMSFNLGANKPERVIATLKFSLFFTITLGLAVTLISWVIPDWIILPFSDGDSKEFNLLGEQAIKYYFLLFLAAGPNYLLGAYLQTTGKISLSIVLNILKGIGLISALVFLLPETFNFGIDGIWLSRSLAEIVAIILIGVWSLVFSKKYYHLGEIVQG